MSQPFNSPAPAPATAASFDLGTGALSVNFPGAPSPSTGSVADLVLTGSLTNYMALGMDGGFAPSKTPGYPNTWTSVTTDQWAPSESSIIQGGANLPSVIGLNIKDEKGQLYEVVYVDSAGTSRDIYKNSTLDANHTTTLTPGGVKLSAGAVAAAPASEPPEGETSLFFNLSSCCSSFIYCAGIVFLSSMLVPKR
jgi:hypothetical protein